MSIEVVTSPKTGVTVSLAGHYLLSGHRVVFTLDCIKRGSHAEYTLANGFLTDSYRNAVSSEYAHTCKRVYKELITPVASKVATGMRSSTLREVLSSRFSSDKMSGFKESLLAMLSKLQKVPRAAPTVGDYDRTGLDDEPTLHGCRS